MSMPIVRASPYLEWVQGEWAESSDTVEGRYRHRRVDAPRGDLPSAEDVEAETHIHARSITLPSNRLGWGTALVT